MNKYVGANFILSVTDDGLFIELNDSNNPDCCELFKTDEIKGILSTIVQQRLSDHRKEIK